MVNWKRPENVKFPSVWRRFEGKKTFPNGKIPKFRIQDATDDLAEGVLRLMMHPFMMDEPTCQRLGMIDDEVSKEDFRKMWTDCLKHKTVLACVLENRDELGDDSLPVVVGCNMTVPMEPNEAEVKVNGENSRKIMDLLHHCESRLDCFQVYKTDVVLYALGLSVDRKFRGQGIGLELLKSRSDMCLALGLKATVTVFTAIASQKLAEKLNYDLLVEIPYDDYKVDGEVVFKNMDTKMIKYMGKRFA